MIFQTLVKAHGPAVGFCLRLPLFPFPFAPFSRTFPHPMDPVVEPHPALPRYYGDEGKRRFLRKLFDTLPEDLRIPEAA